ncbi:MAG: Na+:solute symporter [Acidobacteria bacterium]|nr:Na+:solute symporter [Acidobacteriota bacterium]MCW5969875.1 Na+:solute symporter [Blastocatellales bacterium]
MNLTGVDWAIIAAYFLMSVAIGLYFTRRAGSSTSEYFLGGRSIPWWLAGVSIVATTFSSDTPLLVTGITARGGIAGNWVWWAFVLSGMLTVFFFARLWRRANVVTDIEFTTIRYSGRAADFLRVFRAVYLSIPINAIVTGSVTLAMVKILKATVGIDEWTAVLLCFGLTTLYSTLGGFLGVLWTDFFQFFLAMAGSLGLAYFSVNAVGGLSAIPDGLQRNYGDSAASILSFVPHGESAYLPLVALAVFLTVQWWAVWYPGAEPGGGGFVAQRMFAAKDEKASLLATLSFNILHYTLRPWPWILTALASMIYFANDAAVQADPESGYARMIVEVLPAGWRGVMVAAMLAAYMSTVATQLNWGASYLINDVYRPYVKKDGNERHYVLVSRLASVFIMLMTGVVALTLGRVTRALDILLSIGAGTGLVLILRWYWWRINAWSEISAMMAAAAVSLSLEHLVGPAAFGLTESQHDAQVFFAYSLLITTAVVTAVWLAVTYMTSPTNEQTLVAFYRRTRPGSAGWGPIARLAPEVGPGEGAGVRLAQWAMGCALIYFSLFGVGSVIFGQWGRGALFLAVSLACGYGVLRGIREITEQTK